MDIVLSVSVVITVPFSCNRIKGAMALPKNSFRSILLQKEFHTILISNTSSRINLLVLSSFVSVLFTYTSNWRFTAEECLGLPL